MLERRAEYLVDERRHGVQCGAAGAQHRRVEALQELPGDVDRDVRPRLEVRAYGADRNPAHADTQAVLELPAVLVAVERRQRGELCELLAERGDPARIEPQPVECALVEPPRGCLDIGSVRTRDRVALLVDELGRTLERTRHGLVRELADGGVRGSRLALHELAQIGGHPVFRSAAEMPAIERSSGGAASSSPARYRRSSCTWIVFIGSTYGLRRRTERCTTG